ncbi:hypothetical protein A161_17240 [Pseudomonas aeruginosa PAO579]|nr:hypothetical protein A161_17240 [Pseudomonas aeruginosa PAO579]
MQAHGQTVRVGAADTALALDEAGIIGDALGYRLRSASLSTPQTTSRRVEPSSMAGGRPGLSRAATITRQPLRLSKTTWSSLASTCARPQSAKKRALVARSSTP